MKVYQTSEIKNITLIGNAGSGKTTLAENMLFEGKVINRRGDVGSQNTASDYRDVEHEQEGSVFSSVLYTEWNGKKINILDAPGPDDFIGGVVSSLTASDVGVLVLNAQNGVESGSENHWRQAQRLNKPVILVANHLDHEKTNYDKLIDEARQMLSKKLIQVQYPVNAGVGFNAVIDLLRMKMLQWPAEGGKAEELDIPADEQDRAAELQNELIEAAAESEEELMEIFFEKETLTEDEMRNGLKKGIIDRNIFPVFCTAAKKNFGVTRFMDFITNVLPAPNEMPPAKTKEGEEVPCDAASGKTSLFVFKSTIEQHLGEVVFFKVMSGEVNESDDLINMLRSNKERLSQLYVTAGKNREKVTKLVAGDIGATIKMKETKTGHVLNEKDVEWEYPPIPFPNPKYRVAIKAESESHDEKLGDALSKMTFEDPTIVLEYSKELKQLIVHTQGEHHINIMKWHLDNQFKIPIEFLKPKIQYRETITKSATASYRHKKQSGGAGQFGEVHLLIDPYEEGKAVPTEVNGQKLSVRDTEEYDMNWGGKLIFFNCIVGGVIESGYMPAILKGIMEKMEEGPLTGSYARDIRVAVYDGKMHPVDSNEISFKIAGSKAFSDAFKKAGPKILEPIYNLEVLIPSDKMGDVMSDLQGRRAEIQGMDNEGRYDRLRAKVPLSEMDKYSTVLSSITSGRAFFEMSFAEYKAIPNDIQDKLLKAYEAEQDEE